MKNEMPFTREQVERFHKDYEESARLREAAPALLESLKDLVSLETNNKGEVFCYCTELGDEGPCYWCKAVAVIAKAEGG